MSLLSRRMMMTNTENGGSEMDKWETIIDYTHSGSSVINKEFKVGDDGQPFRLKKVSVYVIMKPTDPNITNNRQFNITVIDKTGSIGAPIGRTPKYGGYTLYGRALFEQKDYGLYPVLAVGSANDDSVRMFLGEVKPIYGVEKVDLNTGLIDSAPDTCTALTVGSHYQKVVTAGTRIIVKGVRV